MFQDATASALAAVSNIQTGTANEVKQALLTHYMTAGTTSSTTFRVRAGGTADTMTLMVRPVAESMAA